MKVNNEMKSPIPHDRDGVRKVVDEAEDGTKAIPVVLVTKNENGEFEYVKIGGGGGSGGGEGVTKEYVDSGLATKADINHEHDDRYYHKDEVDYIEDNIQNELHKIKTSMEDQPDYLAQKLDNVTIVLDGNELKVKRLDGMLFDVHDLNFWLLGTSAPVQMQIDNINSVLAAITSGMKYKGKLETFSELEQVTNKENGDLVVILADESRSGGRSLYVFREDIGAWDFVGEFTFSDKFTALQDTPGNYSGADGKVVKVNEAGEQLYFSDIDYAEVKNKPQSTPTQIDNAVGKIHEHPNKESLDRLGINEEGQLTINGVVYAPQPSQPVDPAKKQYLYARRTGTNQTLVTGSTCVFNTVYAHNGILYNSGTGVFTLEAGKVYRITVTSSMNTEGYVRLRLVNAATNINPHDNAAIWTDLTRSWREASAGPLEVILEPSNTQEYKIRAELVNGTSSLRILYSALIIEEL